MKKICASLTIIFLLFMLNFANASSPDVEDIMNKSDAAIDAWRSGTRKLVITIRDGDQITSKFIARNAYKKFPDGMRTLLVILEPDAMKGSANLFLTRTDKTTAQWVYSPIIRRVRRLSGLTAYDSFHGTDFTYADLGIKDPGGTSRFLGEEVLGDTKAYKIETIPKERWYYSRIVSWIAADTFLPIKRDYYDSGERHWKTKFFEHVVTIDNIPKPLRVRMLDLQRNHSTEVMISHVCYDVEYLPKETFDPENLPNAVLSPVCSVNLLQKR